jgi:small subunit ribosomal protein S2
LPAATEHRASIKDLLISGVHFGHQTRRWNPKMKPYIFGERGGIYIIDLQKTTVLIDDAGAFLKNVASRGGSVLFVGTKKQCQETIKEQAERIGMPYVNNRWLGGLLTNFGTLNKRIKRLHELRQLATDGSLDLLPTREAMNLRADLRKLETNLGGVADMDRLPAAVFVVDPRKEQIAVREARKLKIPLVGLVDTNCDPDEIDYLIPGNDDAIRSCSLVLRVVADAVAEGRQLVVEAEMKAAREAEAKAEADRKAREAEAKAEAERQAAENERLAAVAATPAEAAAAQGVVPDEARPDRKLEHKADLPREREPGAAKAEIKNEPKKPVRKADDAKAEAKSEPKAEAKSDAKTEKPKADEPKAEAKTEKPKADEPKAEAKSEPKAEAKSEAKTEKPKAAKKAEPAAEAKAKADEPVEKPETEPAAEPKPETEAPGTEPKPEAEAPGTEPKPEAEEPPAPPAEG